jgi:hypothetical protein
MSLPVLSARLSGGMCSSWSRTIDDIINNMPLLITTVPNQHQDTSFQQQGGVVGELVYWEFVDDGRHVARDEVSVISEIKGK